MQLAPNQFVWAVTNNVDLIRKNDYYVPRWCKSNHYCNSLLETENYTPSIPIAKIKVTNDIQKLDSYVT